MNTICKTHPHETTLHFLGGAVTCLFGPVTCIYGINDLNIKGQKASRCTDGIFNFIYETKIE